MFRDVNTLKIKRWYSNIEEYHILTDIEIEEQEILEMVKEKEVLLFFHGMSDDFDLVERKGVDNKGLTYGKVKHIIAIIFKECDRINWDRITGLVDDIAIYLAGEIGSESKEVRFLAKIREELNKKTDGF